MNDPQLDLFGAPAAPTETAWAGSFTTDADGRTVDSAETLRVLAPSPFRTRYLAGLVATWRYGDRRLVAAEKAAVDALAAEINQRIEALP